MRSLILRPAAAADVEDAYRWYESRRPGLGEEFLHATRRVIDSILENPEQSPVVRRKTRRALVRRFPYSIFYRVVEDNVVVVACMHGRRDPNRWQKRE